MINVSIYKDAENFITGVKMSGHARFAKHGKDIVCAATSALVMNTINSIENFTSDRFTLDHDEKKGFIEFHVISPLSNNSNLLLSSLVLGLQGIVEEYTEKYITITQVKSQ